MNAQNSRQTRAVIFDLYGTILIQKDRGRPWEDYYSCYHEFVKGKGTDIAFNDFKHHLEEQKSAAHNQDIIAADGLTLFERTLATECGSMEISVSHSELKELSLMLCGIWQNALYEDPEFRPTAKQLRQHTEVALLTNFDHPPHIHTVLRTTGLSSYFSHVVISGDTGTKKPDPAIFHQIADLLSISPEHAVYVGDSYVDFRGSADAGMHPVIIRRSGWEDSAFHQKEEHLLQDAHENGELQLIESLSELLDVE